MAINDTYSLLSKNDLQTKRELFEGNYPFMSSIAIRYSKNEIQAKQLINNCFDAIIIRFLEKKARTSDFNEFLKNEFIAEAVKFIKSIRNEYYVASTVYAPNEENKNYNLFENNELLDFNVADSAVIIKSIQALVPSQRLVFNLFVAEGFDIVQISEILEASEQTVKSNLEKARYHFQKNIEKNLKELKHEQAL
jgi:RNA polymerase sigma-70 factor, ECF subfamily